MSRASVLAQYAGRRRFPWLRRAFAAGAALLALSSAATMTIVPNPDADQALIIGIGDYADISGIPGVDRDVAMMRESAELLGFAFIRTLVNEEATLDRVRRELERLATRRYGPGDRVLIYFSGYVFQVPDDNGDEADNKDEVLALHDTRHSEGELENFLGDDELENFLRDDEFGRLIEAIHSSNILVLVDANHSGSVTDLGTGHVLLSAAADDELASTTPQGGPFSLGVSAGIEMARATSQLSLTATMLRRAAARRINELGSSHTPQLSGDPASLSRNLLQPRRNAATFPSIFAVYERNEREGVPNYVTEDLLLASYGLIRVAVGRSLERERYLPQLRRLVTGLQTAVANASADDAPSGANRDYLAVLAALLAGDDEATAAAKPERAQAELELVLAASEIAASPLWGYPMDYGQFLPRGHYEGNEALERYFRAVRYAGAALFAVKPSRATGVKRAQARRMARQAEQLARLLEADAQLAAAHAELLTNMAWRFGPAEDLTRAAVLAVPAKPTRTYAARLFAHAQEQGMRPSIVGGIVERKRLEKGNSALDVLTGWRLLPQRRTVDYAALQRLVFDDTGVFDGVEGGDGVPFGLGLIDGETVKAFPLLAELMCLWGSERVCDWLALSGETSFAGYAEGLRNARLELADAQGLAALHRELLQTGLRNSTQSTRRTALRAFWTWQRYVSVLYAKQSYTPAGKGLPVAKPRGAGARVEPSLALYQSLARVVEGHRRFTPHQAWDAFAEVLAQITRITSRQMLLGAPTAQDERYLNGLARTLKQVTGGSDLPIVVDVHVEPSSGQVLEEATGWAVAVETGAARGARFTQCEFKHPLADRLTDAKWREVLASGEPPGGAASCAGGPGR